VSISILTPGLLSTIQDAGRFGYQKEGIIVGGAMDGVALRIANMLVGNAQTEACIEVTHTGPRLYFEESCLIAITGAHLSPVIHNKPIRNWRPVFVNKGSVLEFGKPQHGCRAYIAFAGGLDIQQVLGSRSTYLRAGIGGWHGRALQTGDRLSFRNPGNHSQHTIPGQDQAAFTAASWTISPQLLPEYARTPVLRVIQGLEYAQFTDESKHNFWNAPFRISHQSDRMGYRLNGPVLEVKTPADMLSSAVAFGTIQVPSNGEPIILMADHPTTGGYPWLGQVASVDLPLLAQMPPGSTVSFKEISLAEAQQLYYIQEKKIQVIRKSLSLKAASNLLL
jgi:antagonist of KipI